MNIWTNFWTKSRCTWMRRALVGKTFWSLWGGRVLHTVIMAAIVSWTLQLFEGGMRQFVDTNIQSTLLRRLAEADYSPGRCSGVSREALANCIAVVGIDDADFRGVFQQQSPLKPDTLRKLFDALRAAPPRVVAVDLDLSPASEQDWPARERLLASLQALAKVTRLVMVCPQGYFTPEPGPLDQAWVQRFDSSVQFASAELNVDGLYFNKALALPTLGMLSAEAAADSLHKTAESAPSAVNWHAACKAGALEQGAAPPQNELIRPAATAASSFSQALAQPELLADRVVLVGGKWGINDQFKLRGQSDAFFGVTLHAWVTATELDPPHEPAESAALIMELVIGMMAGALFTLVWRGIKRNGHHFAKRSGFYIAFFGLAFGLPLVWVTLAAHAAKLGLVLGAAGMVLSAAADSFFSSHEAVLEQAEEEREEAHMAHGTAQQQPAQASPSWRPHGLASALAGVPAPLLTFVLALLLFAVTWVWGQSWWLCLVCGALGGLVLGAVDCGAQALQAPAIPRKGSESIYDLVARLVWTVFKGLALYWLLAKDHHGTTAALLLGFVTCWCLAFWGLRSGAAAKAKGKAKA